MNKKSSINALFKSISALVIIAFFFTQCKEESAKDSTANDKTTIKKDSLAFGDTKFLSNGLEGRMYLIVPGTKRIPLFDTMQVANTVYTDSINIPQRSWTSGFPGLPNRFEWFGIQYNGNFRPIKKGHYKFRLLSDDGSKLFIDDSLLINNDGLHSVISRPGEIDLDGSEHNIKVQYFQGPRWSIALQLFARLDKEEEQPFPDKYFQLSALHSNSHSNSSLYLILGGIVLIGLIIIGYRIARSKKEVTTDKSIS